jgi:hypothetical protein
MCGLFPKIDTSFFFSSKNAAQFLGYLVFLFIGCGMRGGGGCFRGSKPCWVVRLMTIIDTVLKVRMNGVKLPLPHKSQGVHTDKLTLHSCSLFDDNIHI